MQTSKFQFGFFTKESTQSNVNFAILRSVDFFGTSLSISPAACLAYHKLLKRTALSIKNGWFNNEGQAYVICTIPDLMKMLNIGRGKACDILQELENSGLLKKVRQGQGKPTLIFMCFVESDEGNLAGDEKMESADVFTEELVDVTSCECESEFQEVRFSDSNKSINYLPMNNDRHISNNLSSINHINYSRPLSISHHDGEHGERHYDFDFVKRTLKSHCKWDESKDAYSITYEQYAKSRGIWDVAQTEIFKTNVLMDELLDAAAYSLYLKENLQIGNRCFKAGDIGYLLMRATYYDFANVCGRVVESGVKMSNSRSYMLSALLHNLSVRYLEHEKTYAPAGRVA